MALVIHNSVCNADQQGLLCAWDLARRLLPDNATCELRETCPHRIEEEWVARIAWGCDGEKTSQVFTSHSPYWSIASCATRVMRYVAMHEDLQLKTEDDSHAQEGEQ